MLNVSTFIKYPKGIQVVPVQEEALMWNKNLSQGYVTVIILVIMVIIQVVPVQEEALIWNKNLSQGY